MKDKKDIKNKKTKIDKKKKETVKQSITERYGVPKSAKILMEA
jgi:hypothetical protein